MRGVTPSADPRWVALMLAGLTLLLVALYRLC
jgi:hypothetical protein